MTILVTWMQAIDRHFISFPSTMKSTKAGQLKTVSKRYAFKKFFKIHSFIAFKFLVKESLCLEILLHFCSCEFHLES